MDDVTRQALMQPEAQESLRAALQNDGAQEALRAFHQARAKLLEVVGPAIQEHGLMAAAETGGNPIVAKSVEFANAAGKALTYEEVSDWLEQEYGSVPQHLSAG